MAYAETVPSWFLLNLKLVKVTWNILYVKIKEYVESLKNMFANMWLRTLWLIWKPDFKLVSCSANVKQGRFQRFWSNDRKNRLFIQQTCHFLEWIRSNFKEANLFWLTCHCSSTQDPRKMVRILHYNTHTKTLSNLNTTWGCLVSFCMKRENRYDFHNKFYWSYLNI